MTPSYSALVFFLLVLTPRMHAQYTFSETSGAYAPLVNPDTLTINLPTWDDDYVNIGLPFPVNVYGTWYDSALVETNGELVLYNNWYGASPWTIADTLPAIMGFGEFLSMAGTGDLLSRGPNLSPILMEVTGNPGVQILKIEWRNSGFYEDTTSSMNSYVNFQIWIHEISGNIEFHYGTSSVAPYCYGGSSGPTVGIAPYDMDPNYNLLSGIYVTDDSSAVSTGTNYSQITGTPTDSTIYLFNNLATVGIEQVIKPSFKLYPNPAKETCTLYLQDAGSAITVSDATGRLLQEIPAQNTNNVILDLSAFEPGVYFISVRNASGISTQSLIVH